MLAYVIKGYWKYLFKIDKDNEFIRKHGFNI